MTDDTAATDHAHDDDHGHGGVSKYLAVFGALLVLTLLSFLVGNWGHLKDTFPQAAWALMMAISCGKAMLVMLFFMHLLWEANWKYVLTIPASMMSVFLLLMLVPDVGLRTRTYTNERWRHAPERNPGDAAVTRPAHDDEEQSQPEDH